MNALDRLVWADTATFRVGDLHIGIRSSSAALGGWLRQALRDHLADQVPAPPNYSVLLGDPRRRGSAGGFHFLYRSSTQMLRTRNPERLIRGLLNHLSSHQPAPSDLLSLQGLGIVGGAGALIAPATLRQYLSQLERRLNARGARVVDTPWVAVDPGTGELVVPEPCVTVDWSRVDELASIAPGGRPDPPVPVGRYPLVSWAFLGESGTLSRARAVALAMQMLNADAATEMRAGLTAVGRLMGTIEPSGLEWSEPSALAAPLLEML